MNPIHPKKLSLSKWTAVRPQGKERHFLVTRVISAEAVPGRKTTTIAVVAVELEAVLSKRSQRIDWRELQDSAQWHKGWL